MSIQKLKQEMNQYKKSQSTINDNIILAHKEMARQIEEQGKTIERLQALLEMMRSKYNEEVQKN